MRISDWSSDVCSSDLDCLIDRTRRALESSENLTALVVAGGVAANQAVRGALETLAAAHGLPFVAPPLWLCTDNAAMIGWAGAERFAAGLTDGLDVAARPRWPLDPRSEEHTSELQSLMRISYAVFCL